MSRRRAGVKPPRIVTYDEWRLGMIEPNTDERSAPPRYSRCVDVRIWKTFSANNSSSNYVVATFATGSEAQTVAATLDSQFEEVADDEEFYLWDPDEPPQFFVEGNTIVVYHSYCGGLYEGFDLPGNTTYDSEEGRPSLSVFFHLEEGEAGADRRAQLEAFFAKGEHQSDTSEWGHSPWGIELPYGDADDDVVWWTDGYAGGFHVPFEEVDRLRTYLSGDGFSDFRILLCDKALRSKLEVLSEAKRCPECKSASFKWVAPLETGGDDQMACAGCGGMFALSALALLSPRTKLEADLLMLVRSTGGSMFATSWGKAIWRCTDKWEKVDEPEQRVSGLLATPNLILVTGERGFIRVSRDQGSSWKTIKIPEAEALWGAAQTPGGTLFVVGARGTILRSQDNGESWVPIKATKFDLLDVAAASDNVIYACGKFGKILRSNDGGDHFTVTQSSVETPLCRIAVRSETDVVIVGDHSVILKTVDGSTWTTEALKAPVGDIEDVAVGARGQLFAVTNKGNVLASGTPWSVVAGSAGKQLRGVCVGPSGVLHVVGETGLVRRLDDVNTAADATLRCSHVKLGSGVVFAEEGDGPNRKVTVDFPAGRKVIQARFLSFD